MSSDASKPAEPSPNPCCEIKEEVRKPDQIALPSITPDTSSTYNAIRAQRCPAGTLTRGILLNPIAIAPLETVS